MAATVTVIGAGLSGLATAWYLRERGADVRVIEAAPEPGGLIHTIHAPEGLVETAARAFPWTAQSRALFEALDLVPHFAREESRRRYIFRNGRARRWPLGPVETASLAARFGRAWAFRQVRPRRRETVAAWGRRVFGGAATRWLLTPALQGIYAAPAAELSASAIFGKGRAPRGRLAAPAQGMGDIIGALHGRLEARGVTFEFGRPATPRDLDASLFTVVCTNAPAASALLASHAPALSAAIGRIRMVSVVTVTGFFPPTSGDLRGFGVLFPRDAGIAALGAVFNAEVFEGRSALRSETWIYGDLDPQRLPPTDDAGTDQMRRDREILTGRAADPVACYVIRRVRALPVYDAAVLDAQEAAGALPPHIRIAGNYLGRLGVSSLVAGAAEAAAGINGDGAAASEPTRRRGVA